MKQIDARHDFKILVVDADVRKVKRTKVSDTDILLVCTVVFVLFDWINFVGCTGVSWVARAGGGVMSKIYVLVPINSAHHVPHHCFQFLDNFMHRSLHEQLLLCQPHLRCQHPLWSCSFWRRLF